MPSPLPYPATWAYCKNARLNNGNIIDCMHSCLRWLFSARGYSDANLTLVTKSDCWTMDFLSDALFNGKRFRALTVMNQFTRGCLAIYAEQNTKEEQVVALMGQLSACHGLLERLQTDNGSKFINKVLDRWAHEHNVTMDFSGPAGPPTIPSSSRYNGSFKDECLNIHQFLSLQDARDKIENWKVNHNHFRPHAALGNIPPRKFAEQRVGYS